VLPRQQRLTLPVLPKPIPALPRQPFPTLPSQSAPFPARPILAPTALTLLTHPSPSVTRPVSLAPQRLVSPLRASSASPNAAILYQDTPCHALSASPFPATPSIPSLAPPRQRCRVWPLAACPVRALPVLAWSAMPVRALPVLAGPGRVSRALPSRASPSQATPCLARPAPPSPSIPLLALPIQTTSRRVSPSAPILALPILAVSAVPSRPFPCPQQPSMANRQALSGAESPSMRAFSSPSCSIILSTSPAASKYAASLRARAS
jgi:hypothetical protein